MDGVPFKKLSASRASLEGQFSKAETGDVVFGLSGDRAPGLDRFPIFFQHLWDMLSNDLQVVFNEFHYNGTITGELCASFVAFDYKKDGAISIKVFRSISLIGS